ncbi:flagellar basal body rod protein FlgB (plasmid) [Cupriavidus sp. P-10]|uniref:flagellar basal body rod protein FlgB n=1 Tax=Cupriavidus sp. P-10 TaxID=2027911 RepID=UPI000E2F6101|nr:flagellar basal body rod protein FlgB [Cupriavidus sp. P-10]BDB29166.1 flagellar basal body rod protein FlgB [Cupriavidus sp. P-10]
MEVVPIPKYAQSAESIHEQALRLRFRRLELLSSNIANADTPGYKSRDIDFGAELEKAMRSGQKFATMTTTSPRHMVASRPGINENLLYRVPMQSSIDGNSVEMDVERVAFAENAVRMQFSIQKAADEYRDMLKLYQDMRP